MSHTKRINRVVDYIQSHLDTDLSLQKLSGLACFSEFHFTRVFKAVMGEPVWQFVRRLRLEKSADLLLAHPLKSVTEIALMSGFSTPSSFAKGFKRHFGMSATDWRKKAQPIFEKQSLKSPMAYGKLSLVNGSPVWTYQNDHDIRQVTIENIPPLKIAYVRNVGPYKGDVMLFDQLYAKLFRWAVPHEKWMLSFYRR